MFEGDSSMSSQGTRAEAGQTSALAPASGRVTCLPPARPPPEGGKRRTGGPFRSLHPGQERRLRKTVGQTEASQGWGPPCRRGRTRLEKLMILMIRCWIGGLVIGDCFADMVVFL